METIQTVLKALDGWLDQHGHQDLTKLVGCMSDMNVAVPDAFERGSYIKAINTHSQLSYF